MTAGGEGESLSNRATGVERRPRFQDPRSPELRAALVLRRRRISSLPVTEIAHPHPAIKPTSKPTTDTHYHRTLAPFKSEWLGAHAAVSPRHREWAPKCNDVV